MENLVENSSISSNLELDKEEHDKLQRELYWAYHDQVAITKIGIAKTYKKLDVQIRALEKGLKEIKTTKNYLKELTNDYYKLK